MNWSVSHNNHEILCQADRPSAPIRGNLKQDHITSIMFLLVPKGGIRRRLDPLQPKQGSSDNIKLKTFRVQISAVSFDGTGGHKAVLEIYANLKNVWNRLVPSSRAESAVDPPSAPSSGNSAGTTVTASTSSTHDDIRRTTKPIEGIRRLWVAQKQKQESSADLELFLKQLREETSAASSDLTPGKEAAKKTPSKKRNIRHKPVSSTKAGRKKFGPIARLLVILLCMTYGCSALPAKPATCSARNSTVGEHASVTCYFNSDVSVSRQGINVHVIPLNTTDDDKGKDALLCSWQEDLPVCIIGNGYKFNNKISDRLEFEIPVATAEHAGRYMCHIESESTPPSACSLAVKAKGKTTQAPTATDETSGPPTTSIHNSNRIPDKEEATQTYTTEGTIHKPGSNGDHESALNTATVIQICLLIMVVGGITAIAVILHKKYRLDSTHKKSPPEGNLNGGDRTSNALLTIEQ